MGTLCQGYHQWVCGYTRRRRRLSTCCALLSSSCRRALLCRRCRDAVALAICITAASSCRPSSVNVVHRRVVRRASTCRASSSSSSCRRGRRRRDAVALAICVTAASSCCPSSINVVHCALLRVMRRVSACRRRHVVRRRVVVVMSSVDVSSVVIVMRGHVIVGSCVVVSPCRPCVSSVVGHCRRDAVAMGVCVTSSSWVAVSWVRCRGSSSSLCRALWVAVGRRCISAGAENARETYLQATTTCVIDAASTTQVVVGSPSSLGVLGMAVVSSALTGW